MSSHLFARNMIISSRLRCCDTCLMSMRRNYLHEEHTRRSQIAKAKRESYDKYNSDTSKIYANKSDIFSSELTSQILNRKEQNLSKMYQMHNGSKIKWNIESKDGDNQFTKLILKCKNGKDIERVKQEIIKQHGKIDQLSYNSLIRQCASLQMYNQCWDLFEECKSKYCVNREIYSTMIFVCCYQSDSNNIKSQFEKSFENGIELFVEMQQVFSLHPTIEVYNNLLLLCSKFRDLKKAQYIWDQLLDNSYVQIGEITKDKQDNEKKKKKNKDKSKSEDKDTDNEEYDANEDDNEIEKGKESSLDKLIAISKSDKIGISSSMPDIQTYGIMLGLYLDNQCIEQALDLYEVLINTNNFEIESNLRILNTIIHGLSKNEEYEAAKHLFNTNSKIESFYKNNEKFRENSDNDRYSLLRIICTLINGYADQGRVYEILKIFQCWMQARHSNYDTSDISSITDAILIKNDECFTNIVQNIDWSYLTTQDSNVNPDWNDPNIHVFTSILKALTRYPANYDQFDNISINKRANSGKNLHNQDEEFCARIMQGIEDDKNTNNINSKEIMTHDECWQIVDWCLKTMKHFNIKMDSVVYGNLFHLCGQTQFANVDLQSNMQRALNYYKEMKILGQKKQLIIKNLQMYNLLKCGLTYHHLTKSSKTHRINFVKWIVFEMESQKIVPSTYIMKKLKKHLK